MPVSPQGISIQSLYRSYRDGSLIVNRQYQRKLVWTVAEKQKLIDSILKDYPAVQRARRAFQMIQCGSKWL